MTRARQAVVASIVARRAMPEVISLRSAQAEKMLIEALRQGTGLESHQLMRSTPKFVCDSHPIVRSISDKDAGRSFRALNIARREGTLTNLTLIALCWVTSQSLY
jgi:hypothetical protein